ncbi:uncharacterized protein METZ01_LOCUS459961, partial [marine metagenome]
LRGYVHDRRARDRSRWDGPAADPSGSRGRRLGALRFSSQILPLLCSELPAGLPQADVHHLRHFRPREGSWNARGDDDDSRLRQPGPDHAHSALVGPPRRPLWRTRHVECQLHRTRFRLRRICSDRPSSYALCPVLCGQSHFLRQHRSHDIRTPHRRRSRSETNPLHGGHHESSGCRGCPLDWRARMALLRTPGDLPQRFSAGCSVAHRHPMDSASRARGFGIV